MKNKKTNFLFFMILLLAGFFGFRNIALPKEPSVIISEVAWMGTAISGNDEWIELENTTSGNIDLSGWKLKAADGTPTINFSDEIIEPGYFLLERTDDETVPEIDADKIYTGALGNGGETLELLNSANELVDKISMSSGWLAGDNDTKQTMERDEDGEWKDSNVPGGTPRAENSEELPPPPPPPPVVYSKEVRLNELLPNPEESPENKSEYVELYNSSDKPVNLSGWLLKDKTGEYKLSGNLEAGSFLAFYNTVSLNNGGDEITLYNPAGEIVDQITYGDSNEGSSYNFDGTSWRWSKFLTPNEDNIFNNLPVISSKKQNEIYVNVYAEFSASGKDKDNDKLKYTWDFGDKHKSYLQKTRHKYTKIGKYVATLKVSDGSEDVITTYDIEVIEFPKSKIKIVALSPNPGGKDTGSEYIALKNESRKKVNLKGWSIATGWKKLINHPIREKFEIKPGKTKELTNKYASVTLNNTKSKIELRNPAGVVIDKIKYEKKDGIPDAALYKKEKKKWQWILAPVENIAEGSTAPPGETTPQAEVPVIIVTSPEEIQTNLGNYSESPDWQKKQENKIILASFNSAYTVPAPQGRVLGASAIHETENYYSFTPPTALEKHWAVKISENINIFLNSLLNFS